MNFPFITDPFFYAVAIPAVLLVGLSKSGFGAGFGSLAVPLMALVGTVVGALLFKILDSRVVAGMVGAFTLAFLAQRLLFPPRHDSPPPPKWVGAILSVMSGFTSFIAHAGGPPINAYVIPLRLSPVKFSATLAFLFFIINLSKWIPYA